MKTCCTCKIAKPVSDFHMQLGKPRSQCKVCAAEYQRTSTKRAAYLKKWRAENPDKVAAIDKRHREANREAGRAHCKAWRQKNKDKVRAFASARRAALINACAGWDKELTDFVNSEACSLAMMREQVTGIAWHVDHIVPLRGRDVCGLHVWNNLRVIPAVVNISKRNFFNRRIEDDLYRMGW